MSHIPMRPLGRKSNKPTIWRPLRRLIVGRWPSQREIPVVTTSAVILSGER